MIHRTDLPDGATTLSDRRTALTMTTDIPDLWEYAEAWNKLGADYLAIGYKTNAEKCYEKAKHYFASAGPRPVPPPDFKTAYCDACRGWMPHSLNVTGDAYVCACGQVLEYEQVGQIDDAIRLSIRDEVLDEIS